MKIKALIVIFASLLVVSIVSAGMLIPANDNAKENSEALENSPAIDNGWGLERIDFIHYAKPDGSVGTAAAKPTSCYKLMDVKWTTFPVNYSINPTNPEGLSEEVVTSAISKSAETWDAATSKELFNNIYAVDNTATYGVQNYKNAIVFGDYSDSRVIAVTSVWYTILGKRIVEFDMMFNTDFVWGNATIDNTKMDLQNIATHELGHSVGLADLYTAKCSAVTMFGYSTEGEIIKRTLEPADIAGIKRLYG